jgi:hypothetical protein
MVVAVGVLGFVTTLLAVLVLSLLRSHAEILKALHDLGVSLDPYDDGPAAPRTADGVPSPRRAGTGEATDISGVLPGGGATQVGVVGPGRRTLLAFLTTGCLTCRAFWQSLANRVDVAGARIVIVTKDPSEESESAVIEMAPASTPVVMSSSAWEVYGVQVAPYFVLVDGERSEIVGEGAAASWAQVRRLLEQAVADAAVPSRNRSADEALAASGIGPGDPSLRPPLEVPGETGSGGTS